MLVYLSLLVALFGLALYLFVKDITQPKAKLAEVGRILFAVGSLTFLLNIDKIVAVVK